MFTELNVKLTYLTKTSWLAQLVETTLPVLAQVLGLSTNMKAFSPSGPHQGNKDECSSEDETEPDTQQIQ